MQYTAEFGHGAGLMFYVYDLQVEGEHVYTGVSRDVGASLAPNLLKRS